MLVFPFVDPLSLEPMVWAIRVAVEPILTTIN